MNLLSLALLTVVTSTVPGSNTASVGPNDAALLPIEQNIVEQTNANRTRHGLRPLAVDTSLMRSARQHAAWMARNRVMRHTTAQVAENIAAGQSSSQEAVTDWMNSPGHRANILNGSYTRIGVAAYRGPDGQVYWCQQFLW